MKKQKKCYIYTRVSTAIQVDGYSLDAQKDKLRKYAEYQDMTIVSEFSDEGFSGKKYQRKARVYKDDGEDRKRRGWRGFRSGVQTLPFRA